MPIKFLYIDDDKTEKLQSLIDELVFYSGGHLHIEHIQVRPMQEVKTKFLEGHFDGFIIDQKLDAANEEGKTVDYWGTSLAQNLRTEMIGGKIPSSPIVLLSNEDVFLKYYDADESAHNLFDFTFGKTQVSRCDKFASKASRIITALANAYSIARKQVMPLVSSEATSKELLEPLLKWNDDIYQYTDKRFIDYVSSKSHDLHILVSLLLNTFVRSAGILVTEEMLATKLGIDIDESSDWPRLLNEFESFKYNGVFSELKQRWWMSRIEDWWYDNGDGGQVLRALEAKERVEVIKEVMSLNSLAAIKPKYPNGKQSQKYWVNCIVSGVPLDPYDAIIAKKPDIMPWEQSVYLDPEITFNRQHIPKYSVHQDYQKKVKPLYKRLTSDE
ncbi:hypothetical protein [Aliivibrio fischeri]|uniref:hypothetical protein n=1 Tax=Aliivibrio fischeri TaxID=668 RepID=UPI0007C4FBCF|nr:hypothetical protein [Aliivibrio fischeri]